MRVPGLLVFSLHLELHKASKVYVYLINNNKTTVFEGSQLERRPLRDELVQKACFTAAIQQVVDRLYTF